MTIAEICTIIKNSTKEFMWRQIRSQREDNAFRNFSIYTFILLEYSTTTKNNHMTLWLHTVLAVREVRELTSNDNICSLSLNAQCQCRIKIRHKFWTWWRRIRVPSWKEFWDWWGKESAVLQMPEHVLFQHLPSCYWFLKI